MKSLVEEISIGCAVNSAIINNVINNNNFRQSCIDTPLQVTSHFQHKNKKYYKILKFMI